MNESLSYTVVPYEQLSQDALHGIIEEYINRDGTDYGMHEVSFGDKCEQVLSFIKQGHVVVVFDFDSQSASLMNKEQLS